MTCIELFCSCVLGGFASHDCTFLVIGEKARQLEQNTITGHAPIVGIVGLFQAEKSGHFRIDLGLAFRLGAFPIRFHGGISHYKRVAGDFL